MNTKDKLKALEKLFDANREYLNKNMEILHEYVDEKITAKEAMDKIIHETVVVGLEIMVATAEAKKETKE